jgi:AcrR family transcriptional regulator
MSQEDQSVREKIILAAIRCIEREGIHSLTTRTIAKEAGVNSAAINYYFGAKEKLIDEALRHAMNNAIGDSGEIMARSDDPYFNLYTIFSLFLTGMLRYPGLMKALFYDPFIQEKCTGPFNQHLSMILNELLHKMEPLVVNENEASLKLSIVQMCSTVFFMGLFPKFFQDFLNLDLTSPEKQREYMEHLFSHYQLGLKFENTGEQRRLVKEMVDYYMGNKLEV